jgi:hypothetical protein
MTTRRAVRAPAALGCVVVLATILAACTTGRPQEEIVATSDEARSTVQDVANTALAAFTDLDPDLTLTVEYDPEIDDRWSDCSNDTAPDHDNPKAIQWVTGRWIVVEPKLPTANLLDPVVAKFVADGWISGSELTTSTGRAVDLSRNGYTLVVSGATEVDDDEEALMRIGVGVYSPCIDAPEGVENWTPDTDTQSAGG